MTRRQCPECTHRDEDPAPWCECRDGETCAGPCRNRAHLPEHCIGQHRIDTYVPVPIRWRHVQVGDVFVGRDKQLWYVTDIRENAGALTVQALLQFWSRTGDVDPDDVISVLVPVPERDAVELTREHLGARLVERRTAPPEVST